MPMQSTTRTRQNKKIPKNKNKKTKNKNKRNANPQEKTGPDPETVTQHTEYSSHNTKQVQKENISHHLQIKAVGDTFYVYH